MINAIKTSFQKLIQQLRNPRLRLLRSLIVSHEEPISLEVPWPPLPDTVREFYSSIECLHCQWALAEPAENLRYLDEGLDIISGEVCLPSLKKLPEKQDPAAFLSYLDPYNLLSSFHAKEELLHYIPFDYLSSHLATAYRAGESRPETLFLLDFSESGQIIPLSLGIEEYLMTGFRYHFFYGWQKAAFLDDQALQKKIDWYTRQLFV